MIKNRLAVLRALYDFRWDTLDVIISGKSSIDFSLGFHLETPDEVSRFIESYGYDLENPIEHAEVMGNFHEAMNFIRKTFLQPENPDGLKLEMPRKIVELTDIRELFLMAAGKYTGRSSGSFRSQAQESQMQAQFQSHMNDTLLRHWACSTLKVMHTIAHIDKDLRSPYFSDIQKQIFDRFYKLVHRDANGKLFIGENESDLHRIDLVAFVTKPKKSRDSIIIKLLHKPENVAEDIFDRVGVRFVTENALNSLRLVKYLKDKMVVMPPNIKPSRSRNTLVDLDEFKAVLSESLQMLEREEINEDTFIANMIEASHPPAVSPDNPHSSEFYRAIQFTCRQLIKLKNPLYDDLKELKTMMKQKSGPEEWMKIVDRIDLKHLQREVRFFYPYEIQIMDRKSAEENEKGKSAHSEYKRAQAQTAMRRVMGGLVDAGR